MALLLLPGAQRNPRPARRGQTRNAAPVSDPREWRPATDGGAGRGEGGSVGSPTGVGRGDRGAGGAGSGGCAGEVGGEARRDGETGNFP